MSVRKVAVVTGSNKGIGYAIVKGLCEKYDGDVYLTSRDIERGKSAVDTLKQQGLKPLFHQLDITDQNSVNKFRDYLKEQHGGIDILINNAAIAFKNAATESYAVQAEETVKVNYFATLRVCEALFPLLRDNARVVNVSSSAGHLSRIPSPELRKQFSDPNLTVEQLNKLMDKFIQDAKEDSASAQKCWGRSTYAVSKIGVTALTFVHQNCSDSKTNLSCNAFHPGYVDTDMSSHNGVLTTDQGAKAGVFLALEADFKGKYVWYDCKVVDWYSAAPPKENVVTYALPFVINKFTKLFK